MACRCDAWLVLKPDDPGYTYDAQRNQMCPRNRYRSRLDRCAGPHFDQTCFIDITLRAAGPICACQQACNCSGVMRRGCVHMRAVCYSLSVAIRQSHSV